MSEVKGKHSINIRLENEDFDYLKVLAERKKTNVTRLAHDLLRVEIQRERDKRVNDSPPPVKEQEKDKSKRGFFAWLLDR